MKQIVLFSQRYLRNGEHDQLHNNFALEIEKESAGNLGISSEMDAYYTARNNEKLALQAELGSAHTQSISDGDGFRDDTDLGFCMFIESNLHHPDPAIQENARKIMRIIDQYGNIRKLNYNDETSQLTNRNAEITNRYANELNSLGNGWGTMWLNTLNQSNDEFNNHFGVRANEQVHKTAIKTLEARAATDAAWEAIARRINALALVNGEAPYASFIDKANYYIDYNRELINARKGMKESGKTTNTAK